MRKAFDFGYDTDLFYEHFGDELPGGIMNYDDLEKQFYDLCRDLDKNGIDIKDLVRDRDVMIKDAAGIANLKDEILVFAAKKVGDLKRDNYPTIGTHFQGVEEHEAYCSKLDGFYNALRDFLENGHSVYPIFRLKVKRD